MGRDRRHETIALAAFAVALLVFASPARLLWARPALGWAAIFVVWASTILLAFAVTRGQPRP
jgi:hypothetical protein